MCTRILLIPFFLLLHVFVFNLTILQAGTSIEVSETDGGDSQLIVET